jgi:hypothetical protein
MKKTKAKPPAAKKKIKNKALSKALHIAAVKKAKAAALKRAKHPGTVKKRTLSLGGPHAGTSSWRDVLKLGRNKNDASKPRLELDAYLNVEELATPAVVDFASEVVTWPMYGNDTIGDCTAACVGHQVQAWTCYTGAEVDIPEADIIQLYSAVSGYVPGKPSTDQGATVQDTLTYMRKNGVPVAGHKILAFAQLKDLSKIHDALWMFGSVYLGFDCPESALEQFDNDQPWSLVPGSPIAGGHAVPLQLSAPTLRGVPQYQVVTWGKLQGMTQAFMDTYVEEAWVIITNDWLDKNGNTPEGLNLQALGQDLADLTGEPNPFPVPVPPAPQPTPQPTPEPTPVPVPPAPDPVSSAVKADVEILAADLEKLASDL